MTKKSKISLKNKSKKLPKANEGTQIPFTDEYGNQIPKDWGNNVNYMQKFNQKLNKQPFDRTDPEIPGERPYFTGTTTAQDLGFIEPQEGTLNINREQNNAPNSDIFKTIIQGAAQIEPLARNAWTSLGNVIKNKRTQAYEANQLNKALRQPYDNQFSEDMYGSNQGLQLFANGGTNKPIKGTKEQYQPEDQTKWKDYKGSKTLNKKEFIKEYNQLTWDDLVKQSNNDSRITGFNDDMFGEGFTPIYSKEPSINIQSRQLEQLQTQPINQELQKIPFSNYFSRPRQSQESGQRQTDYFDKTTGKLLGTMEMGGVNKYKAEYGANIEVEGNELVQTPQGLAQTVYGDSHKNGGIPMNLEAGSKVFSEKLKIKDEKGKNKSFSKLAQPFQTKKDFDNLESPMATKLNRDTAELNIKLKNSSLDEIFNLQEQLKIQGNFGKKIRKEAMQNNEMMKYGGGIKDNITKIGDTYYNQDIIDGLERDNRVINNQENNYLNSFGVDSREEFYQKFPTEELYNFELGRQKANQIGLTRKALYNNEEIMKYGGKLPKAQDGVLTYEEIFNQGRPVEQDFRLPIFENNISLTPNLQRLPISPISPTMYRETENPRQPFVPQKFKTPEGIITPQKINLNEPPETDFESHAKQLENLRGQEFIDFKDYQTFSYENALKTPEGQAAINKMWLEFGLTNEQEKQFPNIAKKLAKGVPLSINELKKVQVNYTDDTPGKRVINYVGNPSKPSFTPKQKPTPIDSDVNLQSKIEGKAAKTKGNFNIPQFFPMGIPVVGGEEAAARFELPNTQVPFRRMSAQPQINEINRNTRAGLSLLGNTPTDASNIANLLAQANIQGQQAIGNVNMQNAQNQMNIDSTNAQLDRQRAITQMQENVRFTENIAKRKGLMQTEANMNRAAFNQSGMNMFTELRNQNYADKIYSPNAWTDHKFVFDPFTGKELKKEDEKKKEAKYGGKIKSKLTKKSSK